MEHIQWSEGLNTGIEVIDLQHRRIISMINDLHDRSPVSEVTAINHTLQRMHDYVTEHFSFEEELMRAANYPYLNTHIRLHQRFITRLDAMEEQHSCGELPTHELSSFLTSWLTHHIGHEDQDYVQDVEKIIKDICS